MKEMGADNAGRRDWESEIENLSEHSDEPRMNTRFRETCKGLRIRCGYEKCEIYTKGAWKIQKNNEFQFESSSNIEQRFFPCT